MMKELIDALIGSGFRGGGGLGVRESEKTTDYQIVYANPTEEANLLTLTLTLTLTLISNPNPNL